MFVVYSAEVSTQSLFNITLSPTVKSSSILVFPVPSAANSTFKLPIISTSPVISTSPSTVIATCALSLGLKICPDVHLYSASVSNLC